VWVKWLAGRQWEEGGCGREGTSPYRQWQVNPGTQGVGVALREVSGVDCASATQPGWRMRGEALSLTRPGDALAASCPPYATTRV
jgi:hypothetical protein